MAKRTRASARQSKPRKSISTKVRKSNAERTKKAVEARRCKFSPELEARGRYLFEETEAAMADIAFELGIHKGTVPVVAKRRGWKRYVPPPRDVLPATRILVETESLERQREIAQSGPEVERAQPDGASSESESDVWRFRRKIPSNCVGHNSMPRGATSLPSGVMSMRHSTCCNSVCGSVCGRGRSSPPRRGRSR
jgi:hypothetical protein